MDFLYYTFVSTRYLLIAYEKPCINLCYMHLNGINACITQLIHVFSYEINNEMNNFVNYIVESMYLI